MDGGGWAGGTSSEIVVRNSSVSGLEYHFFMLYFAGIEALLVSRSYFYTWERRETHSGLRVVPPGLNFSLHKVMFLEF